MVSTVTTPFVIIIIQHLRFVYICFITENQKYFVPAQEDFDVTCHYCSPNGVNYVEEKAYEIVKNRKAYILLCVNVILDYNGKSILVRSNTIKGVFKIE